MPERKQPLPSLTASSDAPTQSGGRFVSALLSDQRRHWEQGDPLPVEAYLLQHPTLRDDTEAILDLIYNEWSLREARGDQVQLDEYLQRFAEYAEPLRMQWEVHVVCRAARREASAPTASVPTLQTAIAAAMPIQTAGTYPDIPGYEVLGILGRGGMGIVYKARHLDLDRLVALKMPLAGQEWDPTELIRFQREAEAAARLQHPHLVQIHDVGAWQSKPGGPAIPYLSMEFVDGGSLTARLRVGPLTPRDAATLIETLARAIHYAHTRSIVHRDLKPANVLLTACGFANDAKPQAAGGTPKITDFGLAKRLDADADHTRTGAIMGTPSYMAPEQAEGRTRDIGHATDIYALGAILYETLAGRPPFKGTTVLDTLEQVRLLDPVALRRLQPKTPRDLETICLKCLAKDAKRRYATAEALADDLRRFLYGRPILARPTPAWEHVWKAARRRPGVSALIILVILVALSGFVGILGQWRRAEQNAEEQRRIGYVLSVNLVQMHLKRDDTPRAQDLLDSLIPRHGQADLRGFEWHYLHALANGEVRAFPGGECVALSPDGQFIATAGEAGAVVIWDNTGHEFARLLGHKEPVTAVAFSPDGRLLATVARDCAVKLWDWQNGHESVTLPVEHSQPPLCLAVSQNGKWLASTGEDGFVIVWNVQTGKKQQSAKLAKTKGVCLAFSPDDRLLAIASTDEHTRLWNWRAEAQPRIFGPASVALAFSPKGQLLATAGSDKIIHLWDFVKEKPFVNLAGHEAKVACVAFSPDGSRIASGGWDRTIRLWDVPTDSDAPIAPAMVLHGHRGFVTALSFERTGRCMGSAGTDRTVRLWDVQARRPEEQQPAGRRSQLAAVAYSADGRWLATSNQDGTVSLWDALSRKLLGDWKAHENRVLSVSFSPDGTMLATASEDGTIKLWDVAKQQNIRTLQGHAKGVTSVTFNPGGSLLASASRDGTVRLCNTKSGQTQTLTSHEGAVQSVAFSPDGKLLACAGSDHNVRLWNIATPSAQPRVLHGHDREVMCVAFSADGMRLASGGKDRTIIVWDVRTGERLFTLPGHDGEIAALGFHPTDNRRLASAGSDKLVKLWDLDTQQEVLTLAGCSYETTALAFRPDGQELAAAGGAPHQGQIKRWSAATR
jgi:WD40 repeat protein